MILNKVTNKSYIGSTVTIDKRKWEHFSQLRHNKHHSILLQRSFVKHGERNFEFLVLEEFEGDNSLQWEREQFYMDKHNSYDSRFGYNISKDARSMASGMNEEQRKLMGRRVSARHKGKTPKNLESIRELQRRPILEYKNGVFVREYESQREASRIIGIDYRLLNRRIRDGEARWGKYKGIKWEYKNGKTARKGKYHYGEL